MDGVPLSVYTHPCRHFFTLMKTYIHAHTNFYQRDEISSLEAKISEAKERYQHTVFSAKDSSKTMSALPQFPINDRFVLNQDEAWYTLSIELQVPIDTIMLQSNVPLDVQDIDKSSAVVSYTPPDTEVGITHCPCTLSMCTLSMCTLQLLVHEVCMHLYSFHHNRRMCVCVRACAYVCVYTWCICLCSIPVGIVL